MAIYYVRKSGNDNNAGTSPDQAWATLGKAASVVAAGDTVYVGAGVYREKLTLQAGGSAGSPIRWIADVSGKHTGDAGLVVVTAWDAESGVWQARNAAMDLNRQTYNEFLRFCFIGGDDATLWDDAAAAGFGEGIVFEECYFHLPYGHVVIDETPPAIILRLNGTAGPGSGAYGFTFRRCLVWGELLFRIDENAVADVDARIRIEDILFLPRAGSNQHNLRVERATDSTYGVGGFTVKGCTFLAGEYGISAQYWDVASYGMDVYNCLFVGNQYAVNKSLSSVTINLDNCRFFACANDGGYAGTNVKDGVSGLVGGLFDFPLRLALGWSPFRPWEPIWLKGIGLKDPVIDAANAANSTGNDLYGETRPGWRGHDVGAVEARARAEREGTTVHGDSYAVKLAGAGYHEVLLPMTAGAHTVTVWARKDANYSGSPPKLQVLNIPGQADQEAAMTVGADTWEQLSVAINPTADGFVRVRMVSQDTGASGECYFDDLAVT